MKAPAETLRDLHIVRRYLNQAIDALDEFAGQPGADPEALRELVGVVPALNEQRLKVTAAVEAVMAKREGGVR